MDQDSVKRRISDLAEFPRQSQERFEVFSSEGGGFGVVEGWFHGFSAICFVLVHSFNRGVTFVAANAKVFLQGFLPGFQNSQERLHNFFLSQISGGLKKLFSFFLLNRV